MTMRHLAVNGCFLAVAALAISACQVRYVPAEPQNKVAAPSQNLPGKKIKPGKVVNLPPGQSATPPGLMKDAKVTPPGHDGTGKADGQNKRNTTPAGQNGRSKPGQAVPANYLPKSCAYRPLSPWSGAGQALTVRRTPALFLDRRLRS